MSLALTSQRVKLKSVAIGQNYPVVGVLPSTGRDD